MKTFVGRITFVAITFSVKLQLLRYHAQSWRTYPLLLLHVAMSLYDIFDIEW